MDKGKSKTEKPKVEKSKKVLKKLPVVDELTDEEREAVTIVFHQFETGLREGTILVKVCQCYWGRGPGFAIEILPWREDYFPPMGRGVHH